MENEHQNDFFGEILYKSLFAYLGITETEGLSLFKLAIIRYQKINEESFSEWFNNIVKISDFTGFTTEKIEFFIDLIKIVAPSIKFINNNIYFMEKLLNPS